MFQVSRLNECLICCCGQKPLDVTNHSVAREVVTFFTLPPGDYVVVPQTGLAHWCAYRVNYRLFSFDIKNKKLCTSPSHS